MDQELSLLDWMVQSYERWCKDRNQETNDEFIERLSDLIKEEAKVVKNLN